MVVINHRNIPWGPRCFQIPPPNTIEPTTESSPEQETMEEEEIQPPEFPFNIEEEVLQNFRNISMYPREKRPPVPRDP